MGKDNFSIHVIDETKEGETEKSKESRTSMMTEEVNDVPPGRIIL